MSNKRQAFFVSQPVHFECSGCGQCCHGDPQSHYIELVSGDKQRISQFLGISKQQLKHKYLEQDPDTGEGIRIAANGRCVFLNERDQCDIYPVRPLQCRTYPYWPEIMYNRSSWNAEAKRCEGIDCGAEIDAAHIESQLALFKS